MYPLCYVLDLSAQYILIYRWIVIYYDLGFCGPCISALTRHI